MVGQDDSTSDSTVVLVDGCAVVIKKNKRPFSGGGVREDVREVVNPFFLPDSTWPQRLQFTLCRFPAGFAVGMVMAFVVMFELWIPGAVFVSLSQEHRDWQWRVGWPMMTAAAAVSGVAGLIFGCIAMLIRGNLC